VSVSKAARDKLPTPPDLRDPQKVPGPAAPGAAANGHAVTKGARSGLPANLPGEGPDGEWIEVWTDAEEARATGLFQILDEEGRADPARVPKLSPEELRQMYTGMLRSRLLDQRMLPLQRQGRIGFYIGATGQEAGIIAGAHAIGPQDYFVPGLRETLRVNGRASITTDPALLEPCAVQGKLPRSGILVKAEEVYFHCGKALIRSDLWNPEKQLPKGQWPPLGRIIAEQIGTDPVEGERLTAESYRTRLY